jgi:hypothetical protein
MLTPRFSHQALLHVSPFKKPSLWSTDIFHMPGQQNTCPHVDIRLKSSILYVMLSLQDTAL